MTRRTDLLRRRRRGMTLIEVLVAIAIIVVMGAVTYEVLASSVDMRDALASKDETTRSARVTLGRLRRELQLAYLTANTQAINTYETVFVGLDDNPDRLYFATLAHQRLYRDSRESDQTEITVWAEPSGDEIGGYTLYHREAPRIDEEPGEGGVIYPLAYHVRTFNVRFLNGQTGEWVDEWDTRSVDTPNRLPRAVRIGLVLVDEDPDDPDRTIDIPFLTTIPLEYADPLPKSIFNQDAAPGASMFTGS